MPALAPGQGPDPVALVVVVAVSSGIKALDVDTLREIYLHRRTLLADGSRAVPINLPVGNPARDGFSMQVLGRPPAALAAYWDRLYYEGRRPPIVVSSPDAVRRYLQADGRALGYLPETDVDDTVRVLLVLPSPKRDSSR